MDECDAKRRIPVMVMNAADNSRIKGLDVEKIRADFPILSRGSWQTFGVSRLSGFGTKAKTSDGCVGISLL